MNKRPHTENEPKTNTSTTSATWQYGVGAEIDQRLFFFFIIALLDRRAPSATIGCVQCSTATLSCVGSDHKNLHSIKLAKHEPASTDGKRREETQKKKKKLFSLARFISEVFRLLDREA